MPRSTWTDSDREQALALYQQSGLAEAHHATGVPKPTIRRWAEAAGVDSAEVTAARTAQVEAATAAAKAQLHEQLVRSREAALVKVTSNLHTALDLQAAMLTAAKQVTSETATGGNVIGVPRNRIEALAIEGMPSLREVTGAVTRGVHDLNLLMGDATERTDGEVTVYTSAPRPDRTAKRTIIDLGTVQSTVTRESDTPD